MAFPNGWEYRKAITIDSTSVSEDLTDYQVKVSLTSSNFDFTKANSDGSDIRFTSDDGTTLLSYWIENYDSSGQTATIWVKIPTISSSSDTIFYIYYGNSSATSESNGVNTFDVFDDFDPDKLNWTVLAGTWSDVLGFQGNSKKGVNDGSESRNSLLGSFISLADFVLEANVQSTVSDSICNIVFRAATNGNDDNDRIFVRLDHRVVNTTNHYGGFHLIEDVGGTETFRTYYDFQPNLNQWYKIKVQVHETNAEGFLDDTQVWSTTSISRTAAGYLLLQVEYQNGNDAWFDNIFIHKYASSEPTYTFGSEEQLIFTVTGTLYDKNGTAMTVACPVFAIDKNDGSLLGSTTSNTDGTFSITVNTISGTKVLFVSAYNGTYNGDTDIAGAWLEVVQ